MNEAHLNGVRVILTVTCFSGSTINSILSSPSNRGNLVNNLINEIALACDGLMVMAYGYYWSGSSTTGPVSPLDGYTWDVTWTVNDYLTKTGGQNDKIIIGIPYF